jgi:hypothetical protein
VLARLDQEPGIELAEVDRKGEVLRLRLGSGDALDRTMALLSELGFAGEPMTQSPAGLRWYGTTEVAELSRDEAAVIAARVVPPFVNGSGLPSSEVDPLSKLVATALHAWFTRHTVGSESLAGFHRSCARAVAAATLDRLGPEMSARLGQAVEEDFAAR